MLLLFIILFNNNNYDNTEKTEFTRSTKQCCYCCVLKLILFIKINLKYNINNGSNLILTNSATQLNKFKKY